MVFRHSQQKCSHAQIQENKSMTRSPWGSVEESRKLIQVARIFLKHSKHKKAQAAQASQLLLHSQTFNPFLCFAGCAGSFYRKSLRLHVHRRTQQRIFAYFSSKLPQNCSKPSESVEGLPLTASLRPCPKWVWEMMPAWADGVQLTSAGQDLKEVLYQL